MSTPGAGAIVVGDLGEGMMLVRADNPPRLLCLGGPSNDARVKALQQEVERLRVLLREPGWRSWTCEQWLDWERRRAAHLAGQPAARTRAEAEPDDCMSCSGHGRACDGGDHCGNRMDGDIAATSDVCHDCWRTAKSRTAAEQRVLDACAGLKIVVNEMGPPSRMGKPVIVSATCALADAEHALRRLE